MQNKQSTILSYKYTTSKGRNTYGYNIVTLYANGKRVARTCGGGYDMRGTCLGQYISGLYESKLKTLTANYGSMDNTQGHYGLVHATKTKRLNNATSETHSYIDGAYGENSVRQIAEAIGLKIESVQILPNEWGYIIIE